MFKHKLQAREVENTQYLRFKYQSVSILCLNVKVFNSLKLLKFIKCVGKKHRKYVSFRDYYPRSLETLPSFKE